MSWLLLCSARVTGDVKTQLIQATREIWAFETISAVLNRPKTAGIVFLYTFRPCILAFFPLEPSRLSMPSAAACCFHALKHDLNISTPSTDLPPPVKLIVLCSMCLILHYPVKLCRYLSTCKTRARQTAELRAGAAKLHNQFSHSGVPSVAADVQIPAWHAGFVTFCGSVAFKIPLPRAGLWLKHLAFHGNITHL